MSNNDSIGLKTCTDFELAEAIRLMVYQINMAAIEAAGRELIVKYDVKPHNPGNPKLSVMIMSEVA